MSEAAHALLEWKPRARDRPFAQCTDPAQERHRALSDAWMSRSARIHRDPVTE